MSKKLAYYPPEYSEFDVASIQACVKGEATPAQQKHAIDYIINQCCNTYDLSFRPGGEVGRRDTDFAEGRRFVGLQIVKMINVSLSKLKELETTKQRKK